MVLCPKIKTLSIASNRKSGWHYSHFSWVRSIGHSRNESLRAKSTSLKIRNQFKFSRTIIFFFHKRIPSIDLVSILINLFPIVQ